MFNNFMSIKIQDDRFHINLIEKEEHTYAVYIKQGNNVEKQFYQVSNHFISHQKSQPVIYTIICFFKNSKGDRAHECQLIHISKDLKIKFIQETTLIEEENYKLKHYDIASNRTFIVFNGAGSTKKSSIFALNYLLEYGNNVVACWQDNDNNYQDLSFEIFERLLSPIVNKQEVFLYGSSLGGYCAFYYAGAVNGTVISAAPLNPVDPILITRYPTKSEFKDDDFKVVSSIELGRFKHKKLDENQFTNQKCYVLIDPMNHRDMYYLQHTILNSYPNVSVKECPFAGHTVLYHLNKTNQLHNIIESIINGADFEINCDLESEFTYYEKAKYYLSRAKDQVKACSQDRALNPLIRKRIEHLKSTFKL